MKSAVVPVYRFTRRNYEPILGTLGSLFAAWVCWSLFPDLSKRVLVASLPLVVGGIAVYLLVDLGAPLLARKYLGRIGHTEMVRETRSSSQRFDPPLPDPFVAYSIDAPDRSALYQRRTIPWFTAAIAFLVPLTLGFTWLVIPLVCLTTSALTALGAIEARTPSHTRSFVHRGLWFAVSLSVALYFAGRPDLTRFELLALSMAIAVVTGSWFLLLSRKYHHGDGVVLVEEMEPADAKLWEQTTFGKAGHMISGLGGDEFEAGVKGEKKTADILARFVREHPTCRVFHSIPKRGGGDIDHAVLFPDGSVVIIDSKMYRRDRYAVGKKGSTGFGYLDESIELALFSVLDEPMVVAAIVAIHTYGTVADGPAASGNQVFLCHGGRLFKKLEEFLPQKKTIDRAKLASALERFGGRRPSAEPRSYLMTATEYAAHMEARANRPCPQLIT